MAAEYSGTRLYLGNLPKDTRKDEIQDFFTDHGHGTITEVKLMDGFGFIQYDNENDAKDIVPAFHGKEFKGQSLIVQFARGSRHNPRETFAPGPGFPRPRRTGYRMQISGLPPDTSWQDLKDFARKSNDNVVYSDMSRDRDGRGTVEFETSDDLKRAVNFLDGSDYKGYHVTCVADIREDIPDTGYGGGGGGGGGGYGGYRGGPPRGRSVSPPPYRGGGGGYGGRRYSPPGGRHHSPPPRYGGGGGGGGRSGRYDSPPYRGGGGGSGGGGGGGGYRERSPPPPRGGRDPYYAGGGRDRSPPPRRAMPVDDYPPPRSSGYGGGREEPYPARGGYDEDVSFRGNRVNGSGRSGRYDEPSRRMPPSPPPPHGGRSPPPTRGGPPPPRGGYDDYDHRPRRY